MKTSGEEKDFFIKEQINLFHHWSLSLLSSLHRSIDRIIFAFKSSREEEIFLTWSSFSGSNKHDIVTSCPRSTLSSWCSSTEWTKARLRVAQRIVTSRTSRRTSINSKFEHNDDDGIIHYSMNREIIISRSEEKRGEEREGERERKRKRKGKRNFFLFDVLVGYLVDLFDVMSFETEKVERQ